MTNVFPNKPVSCDGSGLHRSLYYLIPDKNYLCKYFAYLRENVFFAFKNFEIFLNTSVQAAKQNCLNSITKMMSNPNTNGKYCWSSSRKFN